MGNHLQRGVAEAIAIALVAAALTACGWPAAPASNPSSLEGSSGASQRKTVRIGIIREPVSFITDITGGNISGGGANQVQHIAHDFLSVRTERGNWEPRLAAEPLSVERGTWTRNPDGSMETIWKLRRESRWQDGTPFTAADLVFTLEVYKDPDIPNPAGQATGLMMAGSTPDAAQAALFIARERQGSGTVRTALLEEADVAIRVSESHQLLAKEADAQRRTIGVWQLL